MTMISIAVLAITVGVGFYLERRPKPIDDTETWREFTEACESVTNHDPR